MFKTPDDSLMDVLPKDLAVVYLIKVTGNVLILINLSSLVFIDESLLGFSTFCSICFYVMKPGTATAYIWLDLRCKEV